MARKLKEKEEIRRKAEEAAAFLQKKDIEAAKERADREHEARMEKEKWKDLEAMEEAKKAEELRIWKTKEYFEINKFGHRVEPEGFPMYFGNHVGTHSAWKPEG